MLGKFSVWLADECKVGIFRLEHVRITLFSLHFLNLTLQFCRNFPPSRKITTVTSTTLPCLWFDLYFVSSSFIDAIFPPSSLSVFSVLHSWKVFNLNLIDPRQICCELLNSLSFSLLSHCLSSFFLMLPCKLVSVCVCVVHFVLIV